MSVCRRSEAEREEVKDAISLQGDELLSCAVWEWQFSVHPNLTVSRVRRSQSEWGGFPHSLTVPEAAPRP